MTTTSCISMFVNPYWSTLTQFVNYTQILDCSSLLIGSEFLGGRSRPFYRTESIIETGFAIITLFSVGFLITGLIYVIPHAPAHSSRAL